VSAVAIDLLEWETVTPDTRESLRGVCLPDDPTTRNLVEHLAQHRMLVLTEGRRGLSVQSTSYVGSLNIGPVTVRVRPKLEPRPFAALLGYALRLHDLTVFSEHEVSLNTAAFQDLLALRLCTEATRIIGRGLFRQYVAKEERLGSPRGSILFAPLARQSTAQATLPCRHHLRNDNALPNRVLLSGLVHAATLCTDPMVRTRALRLAGELRLTVSPVRLGGNTFAAVERSSNRLTAAYEPALRLIRLLVAGQGISTLPGESRVTLPGFMFDMNFLFQEVLGRFLQDWLLGADVQEQHQLKDIFTYDAAFNPLNRRAPTPRPDFVIRHRGQVVAILDAKYRDLWEKPLPREMLYQLTVYALSHASCATATILYPSVVHGARESRISIRDPLNGQTRGRVVLRPVSLESLARLVSSPRTAANDRARRAFAAYLVNGLTESVQTRIVEPIASGGAR
jgi:5-methylcytosine-specific restriction enzyme subunit McrC